MRSSKAINVLLGLFLFVLFLYSEAYSFSWSQIELHHIFPQAYAGWFRQRDIEPNLWCIPLSREKHTGAITSIHHKKYTISRGLDFNGSWRFFIDKNHNASRDQCFAFAAMLLAEYGINLTNQVFYNYSTRQISYSKIPKSKLIEKTSSFISKYIKFGSHFVRLSPFMMVAWELYDFGSSFDISLDEEKFDKGVDAYVQGQELYYEGKPYEAREKFLIANYQLGTIFYENIMKRTKNLYAEIASKFESKCLSQKINLCMYFLNSAYKIKHDLKISFPQIPLYIGEILTIKGEGKQAIPYLQEAEIEFSKKGEAEIVRSIRKLITKL